MSEFLGKRALVIGAGVSGLAAAGALASRFEQVVVLERDSLARDPWHRPGTPQSRQVHGLLPGGLAALCELFPGFDRDLAAAGAVPIRIPADIHEELPGFDPFPRRDLGPRGYCMSRPLLERVLRRRAHAAARNVVIRDSCRVLDLIVSDRRSRDRRRPFASPQGMRETVQADLVVDASARGTLTLAALQAMGLGRPPETKVGCRHRLLDGNLRSTGAAPRLAGRAHLRRHAARQPLRLPDSGRGQSLDGVHHASNGATGRPPISPSFWMPSSACGHRPFMPRSGTPCRSARRSGSAFPRAHGGQPPDRRARRPRARVPARVPAHRLRADSTAPARGTCRLPRETGWPRPGRESPLPSSRSAPRRASVPPATSL